MRGNPQLNMKLVINNIQDGPGGEGGVQFKKKTKDQKYHNYLKSLLRIFKNLLSIYVHRALKTKNFAF